MANNGGRFYANRITMNPPVGVGGSGELNLYVVSGDPNGVLTGILGDRAFEVGTASTWACAGGSVWNLIPTGGGGAGSAGRNVILRPTAPVDDPTAAIYTTWAAAWAAVSAMQGVVTLWIDSPTAPVLVPPGAYDFANVLLCGYPTLDTTLSTLFFPANVLTTFNGVTFQNLTYASDVGLFHIAGAPLITYTMAPGSTGTRVNLNRVLLASGDSGPVMQFTGGGVAWLQVTSGSAIAPLPVAPIEVAAGNTLILYAFASFVQDDCIFGAGDLTLTTVGNAAPLSMVGITGTYTLTNLAGLTAYSVGNPGDWVPAPPTTVSQALDRIATAVAGLLGGPI